MPKRSPPSFSVILVLALLLAGSLFFADDIVENARATKVISTLQDIKMAVSTYRQYYAALPGDDPKAAERFANMGVTLSGGGDGVIGAPTLVQSFDKVEAQQGGNGAEESVLVWGHLRAAGLVGGDVGKHGGPPGNPFGGVYGIQNGAFKKDGFALGTNVLCASHIPARFVPEIAKRLGETVRTGLSVTDDAAEFSGNARVLACVKL